MRTLNDAGLARLAEYMDGGAAGPAPKHLLEDPGTSAPMKMRIELETGSFEDRYRFGVYLNRLLRPLDAVQISSDRYFWSSLALFWFDLLCPADAQGKRSPRQDYRYILSSDYRHYYRHLVRSPWQLVRDHREAARFLLIAPKMQEHPLSVHGDILEQIAGRQQVLRSKPIIKVANKLYFDQQKGRPKTGVAGNRRGSARRFGLVLRQFALTYDPECMSDDAIIDMFPDEFNRWKKSIAPARSKAA
ncbi:MAG: hypothetical protein OXC10_04515 [Rhodospirillaceae bacterium]|nr:hypothetical protein [Rhodospirillaceae bacterium]